MKYIFVVLILLLVLFTVRSRGKPVSFNKEKWKAGDARERANMVDDLLRNHKLRGKSRSEILELLGEPRDSGNKWFSNNEWFSYVLDYGYITKFRLYITFDSVQHRVNSFDIND